MLAPEIIFTPAVKGSPTAIQIGPSGAPEPWPHILGGIHQAHWYQLKDQPSTARLIAWGNGRAILGMGPGPFQVRMGVQGLDPRSYGFATTHWSVVLTARDRLRPQWRSALEQLCGCYWYPIFAYLRRKGLDPDEAADTTQRFFARLLEKD